MALKPTSGISDNLSWMFLKEGEMRPGILLLSTKPGTFSKGKELMTLLFPFSKTLCGDGFCWISSEAYTSTERYFTLDSYIAWLTQKQALTFTPEDLNWQEGWWETLTSYFLEGNEDLKSKHSREILRFPRFLWVSSQGSCWFSSQ